MKGLLLSISILTSMTLVFIVQEHYSFILGYMLLAVFIALHFLVIVFYSTKRDA